MTVAAGYCRACAGGGEVRPGVAVIAVAEDGSLWKTWILCADHERFVRAALKWIRSLPTR